jgi:hypothetical protein
MKSWNSWIPCISRKVWNAAGKPATGKSGELDMGRWSRRIARRGARKMAPLDPVRLAEILRGYEGHFVAIRDGEIRAAHRTPDGLHLALIEHDIVDATILRVPDFNEPELVGFG